MTEYINYGHRYHLKIYLYEKYGRTAIIFVNNFRFFYSFMHKRDNFWRIIQ